MPKKGKNINIIILAVFAIIFSFSVFAGDLLPLQGNVDLSGTPVSSGGLVVEIWDGPDVAGSSLIYNSTGNYTGTGNISAGKFDIVLGSAGDELNLEYGKTYYLDLYIAGNNMNFSGQERQIFMSSVGTINSSFLNTTDSYTVGGLNTTGDVFLPTQSLASCSGKLITDAAGNITCGVDAGGSDDLTNVAFTNQTNTFITGQTIDNTSAVEAYLNISDGTTPKLIIDSTGNVGINTRSPNYKLDVYGDINTTGFLLNVSNCAYGLVTDANGLVYCSPTSFIYDDTSINASISNLDTQVYNNATERVADNSTLTNMIVALNLDAYNPANIAFLNESELNNSYVRRIAWADHDNYPAACGSGQYVTQIGDTLTCSEPSGIVQWGWTNASGVVYTTQLTDSVGIGVASPGYKLEVYGDVNVTGLLQNATSCSNGFVSDANGLLYCSPTPHAFDDTSINASITNLDTQLYNNATERIADNTTLTNMISAITTFDDTSINATQSQDNSSLWSNISGLAGLINENKDVQYNDNASVWLNLSDISTRLGTYFAFTGKLSELVNDVGFMIFNDYPLVLSNDTLLNNTYARLNDVNAFGQLNHFNANISMADNLTVGGSALYVDSSSGRVGIGTTAPTHTLSVDGSANITGNVTATIYKKSCSDGFIPVPHDNIYTFEDFCVMKYEAKCAESATGACGNSGTYSPVSQVGNSPWVSIYQNNSAERCEALGERYHLITNNEWMTIALNVFNQPENWVSGSVGSGCLYGGHMECDSAPCNFAMNASTDDNEGYWNETANYSSTTSNCPFSADEGRGVETRRTFTLSNGEVIWDLSGNVWEWTADVVSVYDRPYVAGSDYGWQEYTDLNVTKSLGINELDSYYDDNFLNSNQGAGKIYTTQGSTGAQQCYSSITGAYDKPICAFLRGGDWGSGAYAGVFALGVNNAPSTSGAGIGFRCCQ